MWKFIARRFAQSVLIFFVFLTVAFFLIEAQPGDFTNQFIMDPSITSEARMQLREEFGANKSVFERYFIYIGNFFQGEFGNSYTQAGTPVVEIIAERLPRTLMLFLTSTILAFYLGFIVGKFMMWRRRAVIETPATISGVYLFTIFLPWFGLLMLWLFSFQLDWLPLAKFITPTVWIGTGYNVTSIFSFFLLTLLAISTVWVTAFFMFRKFHVRYAGLLQWLLLFGLVGFAAALWGTNEAGRYVWDIISHMVLPVGVLTAISFGGTMLLARTSMLETLREDYVMVAKAKGLPEKTVRDKYVSRNAIVPLVTSFVLSLAFAIDGGVITEGIFSWEGLGLTLLDAATMSDIPLAMGAFLFVGLFALVGHFVVDVVYVILEPRARLE